MDVIHADELKMPPTINIILTELHVLIKLHNNLQ